MPSIKLTFPSRQTRYDILLVFLSAIILCNKAFLNGFPFFYSDSGTYLWTAFSDYAPIDRPLFYGVFLRHSSLMTSLWLVILAQALALAIPLFYCFRHFTGSPKFRVYYIVFIFIISYLTGISINVGQLIPDVFAPVALLCIALFLFAPGLRPWELAFTSFFFYISVGVHNSHFLIATLMLIIFLAGFIFRKTRESLRRAGVRIARIGIAFLLIIASYLTVSTIHYNAGLKFAVSRYGHVFFMARLFDAGILEQYLKDNCSKYHFHLCEAQGKWPWDFLWEYDKSPLYKNGGWEGNRDEFNAIIRDILTTPKYWPRLIARESEATIKQFFTFDTGDTGWQADGSSSVTAIQHHWPENLKEFFMSRQQAKRLNWEMLNLFQNMLISFLFLLSVLVYFARLFPAKYKMFLTYILIGLLVNAMVCGAISTVLDRYQSRVVWLLVLPFMLFLAYKEFSFRKLHQYFRSPEK